MVLIYNSNLLKRNFTYSKKTSAVLKMPIAYFLKLMKLFNNIKIQLKIHNKIHNHYKKIKKNQIKQKVRQNLMKIN